MDGSARKHEQIEEILKIWPMRTFVLIGDSGERDPEIYADLMRRHPNQIRSIYIRNVSDASPHDDRFRIVFGGFEPDSWRLFTDPEELRLRD